MRESAGASSARPWLRELALRPDGVTMLSFDDPSATPRPYLVPILEAVGNGFQQRRPGTDHPRENTPTPSVLAAKSGPRSAITVLLCTERRKTLSRKRDEDGQFHHLTSIGSDLLQFEEVCTLVMTIIMTFLRHESVMKSLPPHPYFAASVAEISARDHRRSFCQHSGFRRCCGMV